MYDDVNNSATAVNRLLKYGSGQFSIKKCVFLLISLNRESCIKLIQLLIARY